LISFFQDSNHSQEVDETAEMEWDNSWISLQHPNNPNQELPVIAEEDSQAEAKDWENTGEGVAVLTYLQGQVLFNAKTLTRPQKRRAPWPQKRKAPLPPQVPSRTVSLQPQIPPTTATIEEQELPLPPPPTEQELAVLLTADAPRTSEEINETASHSVSIEP
jgi:hypothetical protein